MGLAHVLAFRERIKRRRRKEQARIDIADWRCPRCGAAVSKLHYPATFVCRRGHSHAEDRMPFILVSKDDRRHAKYGAHGEIELRDALGCVRTVRLGEDPLPAFVAHADAGYAALRQQLEASLAGLVAVADQLNDAA